MIDAGNSILMLIKVTLSFFILYIFLPSKLIRFDDDTGFLDRMFISLTHSSIFLIVIIHFLSFLKLYETFSIVLSITVVYILLTQVKGRTLVNRVDEFIKNVVVVMLDMSEGRQGLIRGISSKFRLYLKNASSSLYKKLVKVFTDPFAGILVVVLIILAAYIRFYHSITHLYLGASDSYVHLAWTKYLGNNSIYLGKIYPNGYHAVISSINKIFLVDPYYIERFLGPLAGLLIVLSLLYYLKKNLASSHVVWLALFLYIMNLGLPADQIRQISALPQEYAMIFFLPALHFFNSFFKTNKKSYLFLSAECIALSLLIHQYATFFILLGYSAIGIIHIGKLLKRSTLKLVFILFPSAIALGLIPLFIGRLLGHEWHGSLNYVQNMISLPGGSGSKNPQSLAQFTEMNSVLVLFLIAAGVFIVFCLTGILLKNKYFTGNIRTLLMFLLVPLFIYIQYRADYFGIPKFMESYRIGVFLSLTIVAVIALPFYVFEFVPLSSKRMYVLKSVVCIAAAVMLVYIIDMGSPEKFRNQYNNSVATYIESKVPKGFQMEYEGAVFAYHKIRRGHFGSLNWTIISPVEQYSEVINYGFHTELWEFIYALEDAHIKEPLLNELKIPTDYLFLYVEKYPLFIGDNVKSQYPVSLEYAQKPLPSKPSRLSDFYSNREYRMILQSKAYYWAEEYMSTHNNMDVFYEDSQLKVYMIKQNGSKPVTF